MSQDAPQSITDSLLMHALEFYSKVASNNMPVHAAYNMSKVGDIPTLKRPR
jgi:hypothetical protein